MICETTTEDLRLVLLDFQRRGERRTGGKVFKVTAVEDFPNSPKDINIHVLKAQGIPNRINLNKSTSKNIIFKLLEKKKKNEAVKEKSHLTYRGRTI